MVCLAGIDSRSPVAHAPVHAVEALTTSSATWRQVKRSDVFGSSAPDSRPGLAQHLEAVADAQDQAAVAGETLDLGHHRREAGDRADPQVVAVGEAAGDDHGVDAAQVGVGVPQQLGLADAAGGEQRVDVVAGTGEADDPELHAWIS